MRIREERKTAVRPEMDSLFSSVQKKDKIETPINAD